MRIELDHFFILTAPGAPQAEHLSKLGLVEGAPNHHPGQGTANRRFFFENTALELIYVHDADEAASGPGSRMQLVERASAGGASPFGIVVRRSAVSNDDPFPGWRYYPEYFDADLYFQVGSNSNLLPEPLCICMPSMPPPAPTNQPRQPGSFMDVTELRLSVPVERPSAVLEAVARCEGMTLTPGAPHYMEIVFNEGEQGLSRDLRPVLPLGICW